MMNINQAARAVLLDQLTRIAHTGNAEALQALLSGAGLPALSRDAEPAEQIFDALESGEHYASLARRIAHLLVSLVRRRAEALEQRLASLEAAAMGGGKTLVYESPYLEDETYVFNLFLLAARLPREKELFGGLRRFHEVGFERAVVLASINNRVGFQLRRALAEQQHDSGMRGYWQNLLQDENREWNPARRTELLEAWHGLLGTIDLSVDRQDALGTLDAGLRALHGSVERHPQAIGLLELSLLRLESAYPLDPVTWIGYLAPFWAKWPELLQDVSASIWPGLEPQSREDMPPLPTDLAELWAAMGADRQEALRGILKRNAADEGRQLLKGMLFDPPSMATAYPPQEVRLLLNRLGEHLWPVDKKHVHLEPQREQGEWGKAESARPVRRASFDRLARLEAVNRTLAEIERRLGEGDEAAARRFLNELLSQQRASQFADRHLHTAKTLANAATIAMRFGMLGWAETLLREACVENHDDSVSACGLAEVLKARGELAAAEEQYRGNVARWPNNRVAVNGLANLLRKRKSYVEALALLPETSRDCYDLHVRAMILLDLGRLEDARAALERGRALAVGPKQSAVFQSGKALLELRAKDYRRVEAILAEMPNNVIPIDLMRLHFEAAQNHGEAAGRLAGVLSVRQMNFGEARVYELVRKGFGIGAMEVGRQPQAAELDEIFDAEIELLLAA